MTYQLQEWRDVRQKTRYTCHDCFPRKTTISRWRATIDKKTENGCWCDNKLCAVNTKDRYKEWNVGGMEVRNWKRRSTENDKREAKGCNACVLFASRRMKTGVSASFAKIGDTKPAAAVKMQFSFIVNRVRQTEHTLLYLLNMLLPIK